MWKDIFLILKRYSWLCFPADSAFRRALATVARNGHLVTDWTTLSRYLGLDELDIETIAVTTTTAITTTTTTTAALDIETIAYRYSGVRERCYQSLMRWTDIANKTGKRLTVTTLLQVLRRCNSHKLAGTKMSNNSLHKAVFTLWYAYGVHVRRTCMTYMFAVAYTPHMHVVWACLKQRVCK